MHALVWIAFVCSLIVTQVSKYMFERKLLLVHIGMGATCLVTTCLVIWIKEKPFLQRVRQLFRGQGIQ